MKKIIIAALTRKGVIGKENKMPWHIKDELKHFRETTLGSAILMGRKTFEVIGKPLDNRLNIVLSRKKKFSGKNPVTFDEISLAIEFAEKKGYEKLFIIGGENIFKQTIDFSDAMILSFLKKNYSGDKYFPIEKIINFTKKEVKDFDEFTVEFFEKR